MEQKAKLTVGLLKEWCPVAVDLESKLNCPKWTRTPLLTLGWDTQLTWGHMSFFYLVLHHPPMCLYDTQHTLAAGVRPWEPRERQVKRRSRTCLNWVQLSWNPTKYLEIFYLFMNYIILSMKSLSNKCTGISRKSVSESINLIMLLFGVTN